MAMKTFWIASLAYMLAVSGPAWAGGPSEAERLFDDGVKKMRAGQFAPACPDIARSHAMDPTPGTLFTLAECEAGRLEFPAAMKRYEEYLALYETLPDAKKVVQDQKQRPQDARAKLAALASKVSELTVELAPGAPAGTTVTLDGTALEPAALGVPARVKPGEHVLGVEAPGGSRKELRVTLAAGEKNTVMLEVEAKAPEEPPRVPAVAPPKRSKVPGVVLASVGGAAVVVGAVLEGVAASKHATNVSLHDTITNSGKDCVAGAPSFDATNCPELESSASATDTLRRAGVGMLVVGGAVAVGSVVYFLWPESKPRGPASGSFRVVPVASTGGGGLWISGEF